MDDDNDAEDAHNDTIVQENSTGIAVNRHSSWEIFLEIIVKTNYSNMKPEEIWQKHLHELIENYKFTETNIPEKATVKRKIASLKAKFKKKASGDLV